MNFSNMSRPRKRSFDQNGSIFNGSTFNSSRRSRSLSGVSFTMSSISSVRAHSRSSLSLKNKKYKKRRRGKFNCFHCGEEIRANRNHDGVYRSIYRPARQGFVNPILPSGKVVSAYLIASSQPSFDIKPVSFHAQDSFQNNLLGSKNKGLGYMKSSRKNLSNKKSLFHHSKNPPGFNSDSEVPFNNLNRNR